MSYSEYDLSESWPFYTLAFFSLAFLLPGPLSENTLVVATGLFFAIPIALFQSISSTNPILAPVAAVLMTAGLFANVYRPNMGDPLFFAVAGSFIAILTGI